MPGTASCFHGCLTGDALRAEKGYTLDDLDRLEGGVDWHREGERFWGIPHGLGAVLDAMFEALPADECAAFAVAATRAIPVGADLGLVVDRWLLDILADSERGVVRHTAEGSAQRAAVDAVAALYRRRLSGDEPAQAEWRTARRAADAAAYAAADAARAAAADAAAYAYAAARRWQAARLIHHIETAPAAGGTNAVRR